MAILKEIAASVCDEDGNEFKEYIDSEHSDVPGEKTVYVEARPEQRFKLKVKAAGSDVALDVYVDGKICYQTVVYRSESCMVKYMRSAKPNGEYFVRNFLFADLKIGIWNLVLGAKLANGCRG